MPTICSRRRSFNAAFVQKSSLSKGSTCRASAAKVLEAPAKRGHNPKLFLLASQVKLDAFKKVQESIQKMVDDLVHEKKHEVKFNDYCIFAMNTSEHSAALKNKAKDDLVDRIDDPTNTVNTLQNELKNLENSIAEMHNECSRMRQLRPAVGPYLRRPEQHERVVRGETGPPP